MKPVKLLKKNSTAKTITTLITLASYSLFPLSNYDDLEDSGLDRRVVNKPGNKVQTDVYNKQAWFVISHYFSSAMSLIIKSILHLSFSLFWVRNRGQLHVCLTGLVVLCKTHPRGCDVRLRALCVFICCAFLTWSAPLEEAAPHTLCFCSFSLKIPGCNERYKLNFSL